MKWSPEFRNEEYRKDIAKIAEHVVSGRTTEEGKNNFPQVEVVTEGVFGIPHEMVTEEDRWLSKNLVTYFAKHHGAKVGTILPKGRFDEYVATGSSYLTTSDEHTMDIFFESGDFSIDHEFQHFLIAWLKNAYESGNSKNNSPIPAYYDEETGTRTVVDTERVRVVFIEEVYASLISTFGSDKIPPLYLDMWNASLNHEDFLSTLAQSVNNEIDFRAKAQVSEDGIDKDKAEKDASLVRERFLEVATCTDDDRGKLKIRYPVECFIYDVAYALYYNKNDNPRAVYEVYQKYFKRLFEKVNANPGVYIRKSS